MIAFVIKGGTAFIRPLPLWQRAFLLYRKVRPIEQKNSTRIALRRIEKCRFLRLVAGGEFRKRNSFLIL